MTKKAKGKGRKKRRHECNGALCFHGAFGTRAKAEAKAAKLGKSAFIVKKFGRFGPGPFQTRYVVATSDTSGVPF